MAKPQYNGAWQDIEIPPGSRCAWCGAGEDLVKDHLFPGHPTLGHLWRILCRGDNSRRARGATGPVRSSGRR